MLDTRWDSPRSTEVSIYFFALQKGGESARQYSKEYFTLQIQKGDGTKLLYAQ